MQCIMKLFSFRSVILLGIFCLASTFSFSQKNEFELFMLGSKIGDLTAERKVKGDLEVYTTTSSAFAKILWKEVASQSLNRLIFKGGVLTEAYYEYKENNVIEKFCKTSPAAVGYAIHNWKNGKFNFTEPITSGIGKLYFQEPNPGQQYYDDNWGVMITMKKTGDHQYEYKSADGDKNVYRYANGKISEAEFHTSIVVVKMKPKQ